MEDLQPITGRSVQAQFEATRDAEERLAEAYRMLLARIQASDGRQLSVQDSPELQGVAEVPV